MLVYHLLCLYVMATQDDDLQLSIATSIFNKYTKYLVEPLYSITDIPICVYVGDDILLSSLLVSIRSKSGYHYTLYRYSKDHSYFILSPPFSIPKIYKPEDITIAYSRLKLDAFEFLSDRIVVKRVV